MYRSPTAVAKSDVSPKKNTSYSIRPRTSLVWTATRVRFPTENRIPSVKIQDSAATPALNVAPLTE